MNGNKFNMEFFIYIQQFVFFDMIFLWFKQSGDAFKKPIRIIKMKSKIVFGLQYLGCGV
jgi:hypothetical protein